MPFAKVQSVVKSILPEKQFGHLYNLACNVWDVYQKALDKTLFIPHACYWLMSEKDKQTRIDIVWVCLPYTMCSRVGLFATYDMAREVVSQKIEGAFVECGVARGGTSAVLALVARDEGKGRITWLFDSFEGLPKQSIIDGKQKPVRHTDRTANDLAEGYCYGSYEDVENLMFGKFGLLRSKVIMIKGWFQDTLPSAKWAVGNIAILRLDGDWYESTKCCLENLYDNVVFGGYVIIDDYTLKGCKLAVDEFRESRKITSELFFDTNGRGYWRK